MPNRPGGLHNSHLGKSSGVRATAEVPADVVRVRMGHEDGIDVPRLNTRGIKLGNQLALDAASKQSLDGARISRCGADPGVYQDRLALRTDQVAFKMGTQVIGAVEGFGVALFIRRPVLTGDVGEGHFQR